MKKKIIGLLLTVMFFGTGYSQDLSKFNLYKPAEDAEKALEAVGNRRKKKGNMYLSRRVVTGVSGVPGSMIL